MYYSRSHRLRYSFPTRRSSDLNRRTRAYVGRFATEDRQVIEYPEAHHTLEFEPDPGPVFRDVERDRKSTRLNSSHLGISYAVFCLKKKKKRKECESMCRRTCGV